MTVTSEERLRILRDRIKSNADKYFPDLRGAGKRTVRLRPLGQASTYPLFEGEIRVAGLEQGGSHRLVVKFAPVYPDNNEGRTEFEHLQTMYDHFGGASGPLRVPRPLDFFEDIDALLMAHVGGARMNGYLMRRLDHLATPEEFTQVERVVRRCGQWLACYHQATRRGLHAPFDSVFREGVTQKLEALTKRGLPGAVAEHVTRTFERLYQWGASRRFPMADRHGDYGPQNIHVGEDWICVFDLSWNRPAHIYDDLTYFLVTLETMNPFPQYPLFSRSKAMALHEVFLDGYFPDGHRIDDAEKLVMAGYYLKSLVYRVVKQRRNVSKKSDLMALVFDVAKVQRLDARRLRQECRKIERMLEKEPG